MHSETKLPSGAWRTVGFLCIVGCLNYLVRVMITTMKGSIQETIPMTDSQFGLLTSSFLWVYGLASPFAGYLSDRFKRSRVIVGCLFAWSLTTWLTAYTDSFEGLLATRILMGLSEACYIPAALALITDYHRGATRSFANGLHLAGIMAGSGLSFLGGWIADMYAWETPFILFGTIGVFYAAFLWPMLKEAPERADPAGVPDKKEISVSFWEGIFTLLKNRAFILLLFFWGGLGLSWVVVGWLPAFYKEKYNLSQGEASVYATMYLNTATFIGVLAGGALADYWNRFNKNARLWVPFLGLLIAAPAVYIAGDVYVLPFAIAGFMLYAMTLTFSDSNLMPILCMIADSRYLATGYGFLNMISCLVGGLGVYLGGVMLDLKFPFEYLFQGVSVFLGACALLLLIIKRSLS